MSRPRLVINIEGGVIQNIDADTDVDVLVFDPEETTHLWKVRPGDGMAALVEMDFADQEVTDD